MRNRRYLSVLCALGLSTAALWSTVAPASAQIHYEGLTVGGNLPVCSFNGDIAVTTGGACGSNPVRAPSQSIHIGGFDSSSNPTGGLRVYGDTGPNANTVQVIGGTTFENAVTLNQGANAGNQKITNLAGPTEASDAATKAYVDQAVSDTQDELDDHEARISDVEDTTADHETRISDVEDTTADHETRLNTVEGQTADHETRISTVETTTADHEVRVTTLEVEVADQSDQIASIQQDITSINRDISGLRNRDSELADGIAIALAMEQPQLLAGQTFAMRGGWGNFDGFHAFSLSAAGLVSRNAFGSGSSVIVDGGVGTSSANNMTAGRAGLTIGW